MNYRIITFLLLTFSEIGLADRSFNSYSFARYYSENGVLHLPDVALDDNGIYYTQGSQLRLEEGGNLDIIRLGDRLIYVYPNPSFPDNYLMEYFKINRFNSKTSVLTMDFLEVDSETIYRDVQVRLGATWEILSAQEYTCELPIEKQLELKVCMTLDEIIDIVGCPGVLTGKGPVGQGSVDINESSYIWPELSVSFYERNSDGVERAIEISSGFLYLYKPNCQ